MNILICFILLVYGLSACTTDEEITFQIETKQCLVTIDLELSTYPTKIALVGSFNDYQADQDLLQESDQGHWQIQKKLLPGLHLYGIEIDGRFYLDPKQTLRTRANGQEYHLLDLQGCDQSTWYLKEDTWLEQDGLWLPKFSFVYEPAIESSHPQTQSTYTQSQIQKILAKAISIQVFNSNGDQIQIPSSAVQQKDIFLTIDFRFLKQKGKYTFILEGLDSAGKALKPIKSFFWVESERFHWKDALIYQIVVDRFDPLASSKSSDESLSSHKIGERFGGTLNGVLDRLRAGYFSALGVNALWLSPLYPNAKGLWKGVEGGEARYEGYHGYWPIDSKKIGDEWGGEVVLKSLIKEAHDQGIRVIADLVLNHVHQNHIDYQQHPEWFNQDPCICGTAECPWYLYIETCQFTDYLPDVNWQSLAVLEHQTDQAMWWLDTFDFDGLRLDAVPMMPSFVMKRLVSKVHTREALRQRIYLVGETYTGPNQRQVIRKNLGADGLDGQFDFPLLWAIRSAFADESLTLIDLFDQWQKSIEAWADSDAIMGNFIGNHDMERFMYQVSPYPNPLLTTPPDPWLNPPPMLIDPLAYQRLYLAQAFAYFVEGASFLYYGDEIGMMGYRDPDNRRPMIWTDLIFPQIDLLSKIQDIGKLRKCSLAMRRGDLHFLSITSERISFIKSIKPSSQDQTNQDQILVIFQRKVPYEGWELAIPKLWENTQWVPWQNTTKILSQKDGRLTFDIAQQYSLEIYLPQNHLCILKP